MEIIRVLYNVSFVDDITHGRSYDSLKFGSIISSSSVNIEPMSSALTHLPEEYQPWLYSILAAILVGLAGIFPIMLIPANYNERKKGKDSSFNSLHLLLSFAVGSLLADVFIHLLPEAWNIAISNGTDPQTSFTVVGLSVLSGIFAFIIVEMMATSEDMNSKMGASPTCSHNEYLHSTSNSVSNGQISNGQNKPMPYESCNSKVIGYLNLIANGIDNFTHGLAVAGSFLVSHKTGLLTTLAILIHEVPHEIGDFAILLKSGFTRWEAAQAQLYTASIGLIGAFCTLILGTSGFLGSIQVYILGFTAGGFLNIALVTVLPDLLQEHRLLHSIAQLAALLLGALVMSSVALFC